MKSIDLSKYQTRIEESQKRKAATFAFEEGDRVTTHVSAAGSYFCYLFGVDIAEYYKDIDLQIEVQARGLQWWLDHVPDDRTHFALGLDRGPIGEALFFNTAIERPQGTSPWIVRVIKDGADVERLSWSDPRDNPQIQETLRLGERFKQRVEELKIGLPATAVHIGIHPPLSCACAIAEPEWVYEMMLTEPRVMELLFEKCYYAFCDLRDYMDELYGIRTQSLGLADDNCSFISAQLYNDYVLPWNQRLYARYGQKGRSLHADGPHHQHFRTYADVIRLNYCDIGGWSKLKPAVEILKPARCVVNGNLNCRDFYGAFDETLKRKIRQTIRLAAPGGGYVFAIGGETYAGVNPDTLIQAFAYAHEVGRYPIDIPPEPMPVDEGRPWA
ncbi:MAG: uroporphyrinogen decarboxylase family protein [Candidatus Zipacnadales bacterium]